MADRRPSLPFTSPGVRRAVVVGAGSFGTAVALLLLRAGLRTTLLTRTEEQARTLNEQRENRHYLPGVEFPRELGVEPGTGAPAPADLVFPAGPPRGVDEV